MFKSVCRNLLILRNIAFWGWKNLLVTHYTSQNHFYIIQGNRSYFDEFCFLGVKWSPKVGRWGEIWIPPKLLSSICSVFFVINSRCRKILHKNLMGLFFPFFSSIKSNLPFLLSDFCLLWCHREFINLLNFLIPLELSQCK